jgi:WhiB family transcriptional regulator, redox-sensing transcriptional regulator
VNDLAWKDDGACRGANPDLWFIKSPEFVDAARQICERCPVRRDCLEHALNTPEEYGMWGGVTEQERRAIKRKRAAVARTLPPQRVAALRYLVAEGTTSIEDLAAEFGLSPRHVREFADGRRGGPVPDDLDMTA